MLKLIKIVASIFFLCFFSSIVNATTKYITEDLNTFFRAGAGDQYRISGAIKAGEKVTVLSTKHRYSLVRDSRNREGWILNRELSDTPSSKDENPLLKTKIQDLTLKLNEIDNVWKQRVSEMQRRTQQAESQSNMLLEENSQLKREIEIVKNKNSSLEAMLDAEKQAIAIQWFIYGGSVLGVGLLLGLILPLIWPKKRRGYNGRWS